MAENSNENVITVSIELDDGSVRQGFIRVQNEAESSFGKIGKMALGVFGGQELTELFDKIRDAAKDLFKEAINASREAEKNMQSLNVALGASGRYTAEASAQFVELAEKIQDTTAVSAESVISLEKLAVTYTKSNSAALKLTETSVNLAAVTGGDVNSALQQLAGTLSGSAGRLQKLYPALQGFTTAQLRAGAAVDYFNERFSGAAAAQVNTFDGRMHQLSNSFEEFLKTIGQLVTSSPTVIAVIKFIGAQLRELATYFKGFQGQDLFKGITLSAINFGRVMTEYVGPVVETIFNLVNTMAYGIETAIRGVIAGFAKLASFAAKFMSADSELAKNIKAFSDSTADSFVNAADKTNQALSKIGTDFTGTAALDNLVTKMGEAVEAAKPVKDTFSDLGAGADSANGQIQSLGQTFSLMKDGAIGALSELQIKGTKTFQQLGETAIKGLAGGVSAGFAQIGKTLITGGNLFAAFAGAMLNALGQAAIQAGATYILLGTARAFSSYGLDATAYGLISTGAALSTLGGALMAVGGGVSGGNKAAAGGGGGSAASPDVSGPPSTGVAQLAPENNLASADVARVTVNIQGSVLDSKESGMRIIEMINDAAFGSGARILAT